MPAIKKFDVFLSHHSGDKAWVIKLKNALEAKDITVWLDKDEIKPGDLFAKALEEGLRASKNIAFVISPTSIKSKWVEEEYYRAISLSKLKKQPSNLIPIIYKMARIPDFLSSRNWVDFRDESEYEKSVEQLIWGITGKKKEEKINTLEIPFVIAAMNTEQAQDLLINKLNNPPGLIEVINQLPKHITIEPEHNYGSSPNDWKYPVSDSSSFTNIVWDTLIDLNVKLQQSGKAPILTPRFYSDEFFAKDFEAFTKTWTSLKRSGCVLIIDAVSLFHPDIVGRLNDFHIGIDDNIGMVILSPIESPLNSTKRVVEKEVHDHLKMAFARFDSQLDKNCEFEISDVRGFKRWVFSALPDLAEVIKSQKSKPANRELVREMMGIPRGISKALFGSGSGK